MSRLLTGTPGPFDGKLGIAREDAVAEWRQHWVIWASSAVLLLLGAAYVGLGLRQTLNPFFPAIDLHMRWLEQRYVFHRQNPYDVVQRVRAELFNLPLPECARDDHVDPEIGKPYQRAGGYPPWAFLTAAPIVLPTSWPVAAKYFAVLNLLALAITFFWAYQIGRPHGRAGGVFLGASAVAIFGHYKALQVGQYGILINAMLIGVYWLTERRKNVEGGILFGMATLKPQISVPFGLIFLVRKYWKALAAASAYVVVASVFTWVMTRTNPIEMLQQMYALAQNWAEHPNPNINEQIPMGSSSFLSVLLRLHVDKKIATPLAAITGMVLAMALTWLWRNSSTLTLFAIAATTGRLWSYHRPYDDVMLIFLIVPLGKLVLAHRSIGTVLPFLLVGISLWTPFKGYYPALGLQIVQILIWLLGLATVLAWEPRSGLAKDQMVLDAAIAAA